ncbi:MAG TPA: hypothetical protein VGJ65_16540, partial [Albitalea sp.]
LADEPSHFEQAVFADELSSESLQQVRALVRAQWQALIEAMVPRLEKLLADDLARDRVRDQRVRIGLFAYNETMPAAAAPDTAARRTRPRSRKTKDST